MAKVNDRFGRTISLNAAGDRVAIEQVRTMELPITRVTYVFSYNGSAWVQLGADIDGEAASDYFGHYGLQMNAAGDRLVVGAHQNDGSGSNAGHARAYSFNGSVWTQLGADIDGEAASDNLAMLYRSMCG